MPRRDSGGLHGSRLLDPKSALASVGAPRASRRSSSVFQSVFRTAAFVLLLCPSRALAEAPAATQTSTGTATSTSAPATLQMLLDEALAGNLRLRIDAAQIEEARALYELAAAQAYPRLTATMLFGGPTPEQKTTVVNDLSTLTKPSLEGDFNFGDLGVTFRGTIEGALPIYTFGKITSAKRAAQNVVRAATHKADVSRAEVAMNVHRAFWAFQLTRSFVASLHDGERVLQKVLKRIEDLLDHESDQVTENDRLRLVHALATVRVRLAEAEQAHTLARQALKLLIGRSQEQPLEVAEADISGLPGGVPELGQVVQSASERRPELLALRAVVDAQTKFVELRRNQLWPDFFLGAVMRFAYTSNSTNQTNPFIFDDANLFETAVGLGLRFELDVFNKLAQLDQAKAALGTRMAEINAAAQAVDLETRKIHSDLVSGYERIALLERANIAARGWLTASTLAYDIGTGDAGELIDAFLAWAASEGELQKTRYDTQIAHADLARASGTLLKRLETP